jgi:hypothetical protein
VNVEKAMKTRPAREPLTTLGACVRDFLWRRAPGGGMDIFADDIPAMCAEAGSFEEAVWIACESRRRNGKMHSHQTKVTKDARRELGHNMIDLWTNHPRELERITFDEFHDAIWDIRPGGIGPLTTYDVATRVGAYLKLAPDAIYLHTGARLGWESLMGHSVNYPRGGVPLRVPRGLWPLPLLELTADQAEDFLCTYRTALGRVAERALGIRS